ncbi:hypothetical protein [Chryseobacterium taichungense]|uniref:hypothetical protein n=1 Tax=Chryseobacterium taichungense TaxID=295069 RepID=UPI0028A81968|nr:hypothetical protein [Chryseobacterium taichungense]
MGIKANFKMPQVNRYINDMLDAKIQNVIRIMRVVGEDAVNEARSYAKDNDWRDVTGNLRSSIGYVITLNGRVVDNNFEKVQGPQPSQKDGKKVGKDLAIDIAKALPELALIVVAGMNYAVAVESRGKNVLTSAELKSKLDLPRLLNQIA